MYIEEAGLVMEISSSQRIGGMLFADDFVSIAVLLYCCMGYCPMGYWCQGENVACN